LQLDEGAIARFNLGLALLHSGQIEYARTAYREAAMSIGAVDDLRDLIAAGVEVEAGGEILRTHWPWGALASLSYLRRHRDQSESVVVND